MAVYGKVKKPGKSSVNKLKDEDTFSETIGFILNYKK